MNSWVLSIVGIVCLGVMVDIFVPEGQTNKYIKAVFSLLIVFVIISPLPNLLNANFDFNKVIDGVETEIDLNFIASINNQKCNATIEIINDVLTKNDIEVESVNISCNVYQEDFEILNIYVDISNIIDKNNDQLKINIINLIQDNININKEKIIFNE